MLSCSRYFCISSAANYYFRCFFKECSFLNCKNNWICNNVAWRSRGINYLTGSKAVWVSCNLNVQIKFNDYLQTKVLYVANNAVQNQYASIDQNSCRHRNSNTCIYGTRLLLKDLVQTNVLSVTAMQRASSCLSLVQTFLPAVSMDTNLVHTLAEFQVSFLQK